MSTVTADRASILRVEMARDEAGNFAVGQPVVASPGDLIELCFASPVSPRMMTDITPSVLGDSVVLDSVRNVVSLANGHPSRGMSEIAAVLRAERVGQSIVDVVLTTSDDSLPGAVAFVIDVK